MTEYINQDNLYSAITPTKLIDNCIETSIENTDGRPYAWDALILILDEYNRVNGDWGREEHNSINRFLKGFVSKTLDGKELPRHQKPQVNWCLDFIEEEIGEITDEEIELVEKWSSKFLE